MSSSKLSARCIDSIAAIDAATWDACANPPDAAKRFGESYNPFVAHAFLLALEQSNCVGADVGWAPAHALVEDACGRLIAAAPTYLKTHSLGEYVFDSAWAQAYQRAGGRYYPKIQVAVPFTPVTGPRLLLAPDAPATAQEALIAKLRDLRQETGSSSIHVTFPTQSEIESFSDAGFIPRLGEQFHFLNEGYRDFSDFLDTLVSRKRKTILKERREALGDDLTIDLLTGGEINSFHWDALFAFYMDTGSRKWGRPYLNRDFFDRLGASMSERILLVMARRGKEYIAGAINFLGDDAIYGRHWGAIESRRFLHFEICYYQAIEFAIRHRFKRVEAGAQGEHKLTRGYRPVTTYSVHDFADPGLGAAIAQYLKMERMAVSRRLALDQSELPFRAI